MILCALLLSDKGQTTEAETCLLTVTSEYPQWSEGKTVNSVFFAVLILPRCVTGWGVFLIFNKHVYNVEGEQVCLEMANRYSSEHYRARDYFADTDDLAWTASICPNDVFFRTAILLIKVRCFYVSWKYVYSKPLMMPNQQQINLSVVSTNFTLLTRNSIAKLFNDYLLLVYISFWLKYLHVRWENDHCCLRNKSFNTTWKCC